MNKRQFKKINSPFYGVKLYRLADEVWEQISNESKDPDKLDAFIKNMTRVASCKQSEIIAEKLAGKLRRFRQKEYGYPLKAQSHAKNMYHYTRLKGRC